LATGFLRSGKKPAPILSSRKPLTPPSVCLPSLKLEKPLALPQRAKPITARARLWLIRHTVTGLMCRRAPQEYDGLRFRRFHSTCPPRLGGRWLSSHGRTPPRWQIGRAAHCVAFAAFLKRAGWPAHRRAIFLRYTQTDAAANKQGEIAMTASFKSHSPPSARTGFCATPRR